MKEIDFINDIDNLFKSFLTKYRESKNDRNKVIREMFLVVIPKIESFVKGGGLGSDRQEIYSHFDKNYLKVFGRQ